MIKTKEIEISSLNKIRDDEEKLKIEIQNYMIEKVVFEKDSLE